MAAVTSIIHFIGVMGTVCICYSVSAQDTIQLINGQQLPCEIRKESLSNITVKFTAPQLVDIFGRQKSFNHRVIKSISDYSSQRKIKLGVVRCKFHHQANRIKWRFYSADAVSLTVIEGKFRNDRGEVQYHLKTIDVTDLSAVRWSKSNALTGMAVGAGAGAAFGFIIYAASDLDDTGDMIVGVTTYTVIGALIGTVTGIATTKTIQINHEGYIARWKSEYEKLPPWRL